MSRYLAPFTPHSPSYNIKKMKTRYTFTWYPLGLTYITYDYNKYWILNCTGEESIFVQVFKGGRLVRFFCFWATDALAEVTPACKDVHVFHLQLVWNPLMSWVGADRGLEASGGESARVGLGVEGWGVILRGRRLVWLSIPLLTVPNRP